MRSRTIFLTTLAASLFAQPRLAFEVASVKANASHDPSFSVDFAPGGRFTARNMTLWNLLREAHGLKDAQIAGGPAWIKTDGFDIQAKPPGDAPVPAEDARRMLATLLEDRFQLKSHRETREQPGYDLVIDSHGAKLAPPGDGPSILRFGDLTDPKMAMRSLCQILEFDLGRPVIDKTGIDGPHFVRLKWASDRAPRTDVPADSALPSVFTALRETLGLKLENAKVQVQLLVIDSATRPAEN